MKFDSNLDKTKHGLRENGRFFSHLARAFQWGEGEKEEKKRKRRRKKEEEKKKKIQVWNSCLELWYGIVWNSCLDYLYGTTINLFLSKLCRKNPIINVVGWYEMSFMVYFNFWLSWFWF